MGPKSELNHRFVKFRLKGLRKRARTRAVKMPRSFRTFTFELVVVKLLIAIA